MPDERAGLAITLSSIDAEHRVLIMEYSQAGVSITEPPNAEDEVSIIEHSGSEDETPISGRGSL